MSRSVGMGWLARISKRASKLRWRSGPRSRGAPSCSHLELAQDPESVAIPGPSPWRSGTPRALGERPLSGPAQATNSTLEVVTDDTTVGGGRRGGVVPCARWA